MSFKYTLSLEPLISNKDNITAFTNPLYKNGITDTDDCVTNIDDCITTIDNSKQLGSTSKCEESTSDTWQVIVVEEVSLLDLLW